MQDDLILFEQFLNERLKERGMTLKRLSELSGISQKHLEYLARGEFDHLPPECQRPHLQQREWT